MIVHLAKIAIAIAFTVDKFTVFTPTEDPSLIGNYPQQTIEK
jgi:hypothetical protein